MLGTICRLHQILALGFALIAIEVLHGSPACMNNARSPENQVFQWHVSAENTGWPDGSKNKATLYLWIPEQTQHVRGVVVMGANVPEHMLVGHDAIRRACAENDLALVWGVPSFWRFGKVATAPGAEPVDVKSLPESDSIQIAFLEKLLVALAEKSGYTEIASAPLLPVGESGHLLMVGGLLKQKPERCIAAVCVKNPGDMSPTVPVLWTLGTGQEWKQTAVDPREHWKNTGSYDTWCRERAAARLPLSFAIEPGTGHFYVTEAMAGLFAAYITASVKARVADGSKHLIPVKLEDGVLANLPIPGQADPEVIPFRKADSEQLNRPWFFNSDLAKAAQQLARVDWDAAPQFIGIEAVEGCRVDPFSLNSVTQVFVETDGEFTLRTRRYDFIPASFVAAGEPLAQTATAPAIEWICGPYEPLGKGRFRVALDRTWIGKASAYVAAVDEGDDTTRRCVQPAKIELCPNTAGVVQKIAFEPIGDVTVGTRSVRLNATSDSGLPVSYFVDSGPAIVDGNELRFSGIPPRSRFPVEVSVTAWQWGRRSGPAIQTATPVTQTFNIIE